MTATETQQVFEQRSSAYATFGNGVVADAARRLLPPGGRVLDIGCASGGLLALLREQASYAAGIELSPTAAARAAEIADTVATTGIEDPDLPFAPASFDLAVLADVVEHLTDPVAAVRRAAHFTRPGGHVIVSVPNIAHWQARAVVLRGRWRADETGTFDATHLRFFTVERVRAMFADAGLGDVDITPVVPRLRNHVPAAARLPVAERAWQALGRRRPNLLGYQLVGVAQVR